MTTGFIIARHFFALMVFLLSVSAVAATSVTVPDFAGKWAALADRNSPAGSQPALGSSLTIEQTPTAITITRTAQMTVMGKGPDGRDVPQTIERSSTNEYVFDGVERELVTVAAQMAGRGGQGSLDLASTYRAVWTTDQLVIFTTGRATEALATRSKGKDKVGQLKQVGRLSLALDADGTLVVDRVSVLDPEAGGPREGAPLSLKSFYRRAK